MKNGMNCIEDAICIIRHILFLDNYKVLSEEYSDLSDKPPGPRICCGLLSLLCNGCRPYPMGDLLLLNSMRIGVRYAGSWPQRCTQ